MGILGAVVLPTTPFTFFFCGRVPDDKCGCGRGPARIPFPPTRVAPRSRSFLERERGWQPSAALRPSSAADQVAKSTRRGGSRRRPDPRTGSVSNNRIGQLRGCCRFGKFTSCKVDSPHARGAPRTRDGSRTAPHSTGLEDGRDKQHGVGFSTLKFGRVPRVHKKRELVASRFTLQGHLRPHAGKSGPFLLHGG
jgi:hypothetical protein